MLDVMVIMVILALITLPCSYLKVFVFFFPPLLLRHQCHMDTVREMEMVFQHIPALRLSRYPSSPILQISASSRRLLWSHLQMKGTNSRTVDRWGSQWATVTEGSPVQAFSPCNRLAWNFMQIPDNLVMQEIQIISLVQNSHVKMAIRCLTGHVTVLGWAVDYVRQKSLWLAHIQKCLFLLYHSDFPMLPIFVL